MTPEFGSWHINIKNKSLFAYMMRGQLLWSAGSVISQFGYCLSCRKGITDCYFTSPPALHVLYLPYLSSCCIFFLSAEKESIFYLLCFSSNTERRAVLIMEVLLPLHVDQWPHPTSRKWWWRNQSRWGWMSVMFIKLWDWTWIGIVGFDNEEIVDGRY